MPLPPHRTNWVLAAALSMTVPMVSAAPVPGFDFAYQIGGDRKVAPVQVFDDGQETYLQMPTGALQPKVFAVDATGVRTEVPAQAKYPYLVLRGVSEKLVLHTTGAQASIDYVGSRTRAAAPLVQVPATTALVTAAPPSMQVRAHSGEPAAPGYLMNAVWRTTQPSSLPSKPTLGVTNATRSVDNVPFAAGRSTLGPKGLKAITRIASEASLGERFIVVGLPDPGAEHLAELRAETLRATLIRLGVAPTQISVRTAATPQASDISSAYDSQILRERATPAVQAIGFVSEPLGAPTTTLTAAARADQVPSAPAPPAVKRLAQPPVEAGASANPDPTIKERVMALVRAGALTTEEAIVLLEASQRKPAAPQATVASPKPAWDVRPEDGTVRRTLTKWAKDAGWQLVWESPTDYQLEAGARIEGSFEQAVEQVALATQLKARLFRGNKVLVVQE